MAGAFDFDHLAGWLLQQHPEQVDEIAFEAHVALPKPPAFALYPEAPMTAERLRRSLSTRDWLHLHRAALKAGYPQPAEALGTELCADVRVSREVLHSTRFDLLPKLDQQAARNLAEELLARGYLRGVLHGEDLLGRTLELRYYLRVALPQPADWAAYFQQYPHLAHR